MCAEPSSSDGFGGVGPDARMTRSLTCSSGANSADSGMSWTIRFERPTLRTFPNIRCCDGRRKSASTRSVGCPAWASTMARLAAVRDLPSSGTAEVMTTVFTSLSTLEKRRLVRSALYASTTGESPPSATSSPRRSGFAGTNAMCPSGTRPTRSRRISSLRTD